MIEIIMTILILGVVLIGIPALFLWWWIRVHEVYGVDSVLVNIKNKIVNWRWRKKANYLCPECGAECTDYREADDWGFYYDDPAPYRCERRETFTAVDADGKVISGTKCRSCGWFSDDEVIKK